MKKKQNTGLTLIELLLVVAIMGIVSVATFPLGVNFNRRNQARNTRDTIVSYLNTARSFAMAGRHSNSWGVQITEDEVVLFSGASYESRDEALDQEFSFPAFLTITPSPLTLIFEKEVGVTTEQIIHIEDADGSIDIISISSQGLVTVN